MGIFHEKITQKLFFLFGIGRDNQDLFLVPLMMTATARKCRKRVEKVPVMEDSRNGNVEFYLKSQRIMHFKYFQDSTVTTLLIVKRNFKTFRQ